MPITKEPLTIDCFCPGKLLVHCILDKFIVTYHGYCNSQGCWYSASINSCGAAVQGGGGDGVVLWSAACNEKTIEFSYWFGRSLFSDVYEDGTFCIRIEARYFCTFANGTTGYKYRSVNPGGGGAEGCSTATAPQVEFSDGCGHGWVSRSRPLGCTDVTVFTDSPLSAPWELDYLPPDGERCFCASGGWTIDDGAGNITPPRYYYILSSGNLGAQTLDPLSGCLVGEPDPNQPGTNFVVINVFELNSQELASVECGFFNPACVGGETVIKGNRFV